MLATPPATSTPSIGQMLRDWRQRRRLSQLDLALDAEISTRHLSFVETGRANPSLEMLAHLAERLEVPPRERNALFVTTGYAPVYPEHTWADPAMEAARRAVGLILKGHGPYPALAIDRHWQLIDANASAQAFMAQIDPRLVQAPLNVLRLSLHPLGMAPRIVNLEQWRMHLFARLSAQIAASGDAVLVHLLEEIEAHPVPPQEEAPPPVASDLAGIAVPLRYRGITGQVLNLISTTTVFGTPVDITLSELALETYFPADDETAAYLRRHHGPAAGA